MKILAVCGFGVGTSLLLRMSIESACSQLGISAEVENVDVTSVSGLSADLIMSSAEIAGELSGISIPVVVVNNFMDLGEIKDKLQKQLSNN